MRVTDESPLPADSPEQMVRAALTRSALPASDEEIAALVSGYGKATRQLEAMREWIDPTAEPALTFAAAPVLPGPDRAGRR